MANKIGLVVATLRTGNLGFSTEPFFLSNQKSNSQHTTNVNNFKPKTILGELASYKNCLSRRYSEYDFFFRGSGLSLEHNE